MDYSYATSASDAYAEMRKYHLAKVVEFTTELEKVKSGNILGLTTQKLAMLQVKRMFHEEEANRLERIVFSKNKVNPSDPLIKAITASVMRQR